MTSSRPSLIVLFLLACWSVALASPSRIKDIAVVNGLGKHKLLGYGLVAGLEGSGDSDTSALTTRSIANMLEAFGVTVTTGDLTAKNVAAVMVTAELPPIMAVGSTLDVTVSSLADAKSLQGGTLLLTPLKAADSQVYAIAQGAITVGGFNVQTATGEAVQKNHVTVGRVPNGASVVKALAADLRDLQQLSLSLLEPDFTTAVRMARAINEALCQEMATAVDNATVQVVIPPAVRDNLPPFIVTLENLSVEPDTAARVVINERTGTVVIGQRVRLMPVAICHGGLTVEVHGQTQVSQPPPLVGVAPSAAASAGITGQVGQGVQPAVTEQKPPAGAKPAPPVQEVAPAVIAPAHLPPGGSLTGGSTVVVRQEELKVQEKGGSLALIPEQATLEDLVTALNALGVKPRDLIAIIQALKEAHALRAELVLF